MPKANGSAVWIMVAIGILGALALGASASMSYARLEERQDVNCELLIDHKARMSLLETRLDSLAQGQVEIKVLLKHFHEQKED